jgi:hypothetical protein
LAGLGARLLDITILDINAGVVLLDAALRAARPEDDRISSAPAAAQRLVRASGGLPLALRITAALLATDPTLTVEDVDDELTDEMHRLEALRYDDGGARARHRWRLRSTCPTDNWRRPLRGCSGCCRSIPDPRCRRLLPQRWRAAQSARHAECLASSPKRIWSSSQPVGAGRWRMHDLLRLYARQLSDTYTEADQREQAQDRLLDFYLNKARAADAHLRALTGTPVPADFTGRDDALAWLDAERPVCGDWRSDYPACWHPARLQEALCISHPTCATLCR